MVKISAIIPTRGDVLVEPLRIHLQECFYINDIHFVEGDGPYTRYEAISRCDHSIIYTQDDDCITDLLPLIAGYEPGIIVNAMTPEHEANYRGLQTLVGFGAIFDAGLARCLDGWERDDLFKREADRVFTALNFHKTVYPKIEILPWATSESRMYRQPEHSIRRKEINERIFAMTGVRP